MGYMRIKLYYTRSHILSTKGVYRVLVLTMKVRLVRPFLPRLGQVRDPIVVSIVFSIIPI